MSEIPLWTQLGLSAVFLAGLVVLWRDGRRLQAENRAELASLVRRYEHLLEESTRSLVALAKDLERKNDS